MPVHFYRAAWHHPRIWYFLSYFLLCPWIEETKNEARGMLKNGITSAWQNTTKPHICDIRCPEGESNPGNLTTRSSVSPWLWAGSLWRPCNRYVASHADRHRPHVSICVIQQRLTVDKQLDLSLWNISSGRPKRFRQLENLFAPLSATDSVYLCLWVSESGD